MKFNKILMTSMFVLSAFFLSAQTKEVTVTEDVFNPHWYVSGQLGAQETLGEVGFGELLSLNAQLGGGYNFTPALGARLTLNAWQSKAGLLGETWKWNYVAPVAAATLDLTNLIGGWKVDRLCQAGVLAGIGANIAFNNKEAGVIKDSYTAQGVTSALGKYWDKTKLNVVGQLGTFVDFNVCKNLSVGLELQANVLPDNYNSKRAGNADWYFNALVGVKYTFGNKSKKETRTMSVPAIIVTDTVVVEREKLVEKIVEKTIKPEPLHRDVFFSIGVQTVSSKELPKVAEIAAYMNACPESKVHVVGYADFGTGSKQTNLRISENRAKAVAKLLVDQYGISADRIIVDSMDEKMEQPYETPAQNRVAICIAE